MSLFQCENCGCSENTALSYRGHKMLADSFDWTGKESLKGRMVCSACGPEKYRDGKATEYAGKWHGLFDRTFLPLGMFKTNKVGNLEHIESGSENFRDYAIEQPDIGET